MKKSWLLPLALALAALCLTPRTIHAQTATQLYGEGVDALKAGDIPTAKKKLQLTLEVDKNFRPASALLNRIALEEKQGGAQKAGPTPQILSKLIVPVEFKDTSLQTAVEVLRQRIEAVSGGQTKVNFVLSVPSETAAKKLTLQLDHVPVTETLRYMGDLVGVTFRIDKYAIVITPVGGEQPAASAPSGTAAPTP